MAKKGRKKGSSDSVDIKISALLEALPKGADTIIPVRRKWIENMESLLGVRFENEHAPEVVDNSFTESDKRQKEKIAPEIID